MHVFLTIALVALTAVSSGRAEASGARSLAALNSSGIAADGKEILFDVHREGRRVGFHRVRFKSTADGIVVEAAFQIEISFLGLTLYRYRYDSRALWSDVGLESIRATVDDDGVATEVQARRIGSRFYVATGDTAYDAPAPIFPTNHWNPEVVGHDRVLNTLTGKINQVRIQPQEAETIETENGPVLATRYVYTGDLQTEVWYDAAGRWVKMRFKGRDGSTLEYKCRQCLTGGAGAS